MKNKIFTFILGVAIFFIIITFSIGLPIYCRFFYYFQIDSLNLVETSGYSYETIKTAYDEMLNFLIYPAQEFSTGALKFNEAGKAHFVDCKVLFDLNITVFIICALTIAIILILKKKKVISLCKPFKMHVAFTSAVSIFLVFSILGLLVASNFDNAFIIFHKIFFPGKDNWHFNPRDMEIINILPQEFFLNCAILIGASIILISLTIIIYQLIKRKKASKPSPCKEFSN